MKKYILLITTIFTVGITGCKKDFLSLEVNPNAPSVATPGFLLTGALKTAADIVNIDYSEYGVWSGFLAPSGNYVPSTTLQQYQFTNATYQGVWTDLYSNLTNFNNLQLQSTDPSQANYAAIAMIMKVYDFQQLVDNFNDVPYTQAFQASTIFFPKYDKAAAIYADLMVQLDNAIALITANPGAALPGSADIVFGKTAALQANEMKNWQKFANTLKLRLAIRQSNVAQPSSFTAELAKTSSIGYIDDSFSVSVNPGYTNAAGKQSPYYAVYGYDATGNASATNQSLRANAFIVSLMLNANDPRASQYFTLAVPPGSPSGTAASIYRGNEFGNTVVFLSNTYTSGTGPGLAISPTQDAILLSSAEACFLLSEGDLNGYLSVGTAQDYYQRGITANFLQVGLNATQATTYYSQNFVNVGWNASTNKQQAIITQKWIALDTYNFLEAYNEYRRTGYPNLPQSKDPSAISATLPTRLYYPLTEVNTNGTQLAAEGTINPFTSKIFWAK